MKKFTLVLTLTLCMWGIGLAADNLLIDDFQGAIEGGPDGTVDFGAGNGSNVEVSADTAISKFGRQSLKVAYDAVPGGYIWVARGWGLDAARAGWLFRPEDIEWEKYRAISFYVYGANSGATIAFDIKDYGNEIWRFLFKDDFTGWKEILCPFDAFFARGDWQPDSADKNAVIDFPLKSYQFEPLPEAKGVVYFDHLELIAK